MKGSRELRFGTVAQVMQVTVMMVPKQPSKTAAVSEKCMTLKGQDIVYSWLALCIS